MLFQLHIFVQLKFLTILLIILFLFFFFFFNDTATTEIYTLSLHDALPITRDGPGWRADVDLPPGVTVGDVVDKRPELASGLRRPLGCVWPEGDPGVHEIGRAHV